MSLTRALLHLCVLLLVLAATAVSAGAPVYGTDEVGISIVACPHSTARTEQIASCSAGGGVLAPMVTDAVYTMVFDKLTVSGFDDSFSYMGGSSLLSELECTSEEPSLDCVWRWDQGRYAGTKSAIPFYAGNRDPSVLPGAKMLSTTVGNYWGVSSGGQEYPGPAMLRYGVVVRQGRGNPFWADSNDSKWGYGQVANGNYHTVCAIDMLTITANAASAATTTVESSAAKGGEANLPAIVGIAVVAAIVVGNLMAVLVVLTCCRGCPCIAGTPADASTSSDSTVSAGASSDDSEDTQSDVEGASRSSTTRARRSECDDVSSRSFHNETPSKAASSRGSSFRGIMEEAEVSQDGDAITIVSGSPSVRPSSRTSRAVAHPPPPASTSMMRDSWHTWQSPRPGAACATHVWDNRVHRRSSSTSFAE